VASASPSVARPVSPSAMCCVPAAIRRCVPRRSASMCALPMDGLRAGGRAGRLAGAGSPSPRAASRLGHPIGQSTDGLVMVLLGGVETLTGPVVGAAISPGCATRSPARPISWRHARLVILLTRRRLPAGPGWRAQDTRRTLAAGMSDVVLQVDGLHKASARAGGRGCLLCAQRRRASSADRATARARAPASTC